MPLPAEVNQGIDNQRERGCGKIECSVKRGLAISGPGSRVLPPWP